MQYLYLHGFASSKNSAKARFFEEKFASIGKSLTLLDLNLGDFSQITVSKQVAFVQDVIAGSESILIGSSLGGLISLLVAEANPNVRKVMLMAPAFGINQLLPNLLGNDNMWRWQEQGSFPIFHYGYKAEVNLHYAFIEDLLNLPCQSLQRPVEALLFHGKNDTTIPITGSYNYIKRNHAARMLALDSGHSLEDQMEFMWQESQAFLFNC